METYQLTLNRQEAALIGLIRKIGSGYIEGIGISKGSPTTLKGVTQRLDLSRPEDLDRTIEDVRGTLLLDHMPILPGIGEDLDR